MKLGNANADFFGIGATIRLTVDLKDMTLDDRRSIFNALLPDTEANPGQKKMSAEQRSESLVTIVAFCGWEGNFRGGRG